MISITFIIIMRYLIKAGKYSHPFWSMDNEHFPFVILFAIVEVYIELASIIALIVLALLVNIQ